MFINEKDVYKRQLMHWDWVSPLSPAVRWTLLTAGKNRPAAVSSSVRQILLDFSHQLCYTVFSKNTQVFLNIQAKTAKRRCV